MYTILFRRCYSAKKRWIGYLTWPSSLISSKMLWLSTLAFEKGTANSANKARIVINQSPAWQIASLLQHLYWKVLEMWKLKVKNLTSHFKPTLHAELSPLALSLSVCRATSPLALHCPDIPGCPHLRALQQPGTSTSRLPHFPFVLNTVACSII